MSKMWLVAKREYLHNIKRPAFLFAALGTPFMFVAIMVLSVAIFSSTELRVDDLSQLGYVDNEGILTNPVGLEEYPDLFTPYADEDAVRQALNDGTVDGYFVISEGYTQSGRIDLYSYDGLPEDLRETVDAFISQNLLQTIDSSLPDNLLLGDLEMNVRLGDDGQDLSEQSVFGLLIFPLVFAVVFIMATQITSGFLMSGLVDERTNHIMEVLVTSVTPGQLLTGKLFGLFLLGLTQLVLWSFMAWLVSFFGRDIPFLSGIQLSPELLIFGLLYFILGYLMISSLMAGIGAIVDSEQESRQLAFFVTFPLAIPYFFIVVFFTDPNGTIPMILSFIPFTAPMSMVMRLGMTTVPLWQVGVSMALLLLTTVFATWISVKVFRWGLLLYGKKLRLGTLIAVIRGNADGYVAPAKETTV